MAMKDVETVEENWAASGLVWGNFWGGGKGGYQARNVYGKTRDELLDEANKLLKSGGLDSGMGYESVEGAMLCLKKTKMISVDGEEFYNHETEIVVIGDLDEEAQDVLRENLNCW